MKVMVGILQSCQSAISRYGAWGLSSLACLSGRGECDWQAVEPAQRIVVATLDRTTDLDRSYSLGKRRQDHFAFQPGHQLTDTHVHTATESDVPRGLSGNVVSIRLRP